MFLSDLDIYFLWIQTAGCVVVLHNEDMFCMMDRQPSVWPGH